MTTKSGSKTSAQPLDSVIHELKERAKELNCLYTVQELLNTPGLSLDKICQGILKAIPPAWQYPDICATEIVYHGKTYHTREFTPTPWLLSTAVVVNAEVVGTIRVYYLEERPKAGEGPFLPEERKLINTIANQFGFYLLHQQLKEVFEAEVKQKQKRKNEWVIILDLLKRTDPDLLFRISRHMINFLGWHGISDADSLLDSFIPVHKQNGEVDENQPVEQQSMKDMLQVSSEVFEIASQHLSRDVILENIQKWIKEERSGFLINALLNPGSSFSDISSAIERYRLLSSQGIELAAPREQWFRTSLIRRTLSDQNKFIEIAKRYIDIEEFGDFLRRVIHPANSHGKLGGKSSGLLLAEQILKKTPALAETFKNIKTPRTWYLCSDSVLYFMSYNNMEDVIEQKYKDISQVRQEYPYIVHLFKSSSMPPEIEKGLSLALDDFGDVPLIVRSSSLLEDQSEAAFAGKYKSLFIANKGSKEKRLAALVDAIAEVFASLFGPDPIEYRSEHGFLDQHEEMGIMIQEVVGTQIGNYYLPAFAGVAFSNNEYRWSSRIKREDGLVRIVPGLGTRAVDRMADDYPILVTPGQPGLRVNVTTDEIIHYAPKKMDVINLKTRKFETIEILPFIKKYGREIPMVNQMVSILEQDYIQPPAILHPDFEANHFIVTLEGLFSRTPFLKQMQAILSTLQQAFNHPIDIEFAHDGTNFYLLQCRAQSFSPTSSSSVIPHDISREKILFTANRYISNGKIPEIKYVVYVDPVKYTENASYQEMINIARAVSRLNKVLPRRQFILMGPGRWGSRGDIKLGVQVTYSDINNTAMLIEIARRKKDYLPELSFGTHFFQDLVEASIHYLPLYPDDSKIVFNESYFNTGRNLLSELLPDLQGLSEIIRVIDVSSTSPGNILRILLNADSDEAIGFLSEPGAPVEFIESGNREFSPNSPDADSHWRWRLHAAENIAAHLDPSRYGVKAIYIIGSTKNATAGPQSDIDLMIHTRGTEAQNKELLTWLDGWSLSLAQINFQRTGLKSDRLLDVHLITDDDIERGNSYAVKIGAVTDPARPLALGTALQKKK